ncbi:MAG: CHAD domain-containing protein [Armatimonadota bacterium]
MKKSPIEVTAETAFGIAAQKSISNLYEQMISNFEGTVAGNDIEALHDMRVASRRLRAALRVFKASLPSKEFADVVEQVRSVTQALGSVRDLDVFIDYLENEKLILDQDIDWLIDVEKAEAERERIRIDMLNTLNDLQSGSLESDITLMLSKSKMTNARSKNFMAAQAVRLITPGLADLISISYAIYNSELITEIHQMRIAAKKLRYTMEAFIPCFGRPLIEMISEVKLLQEQLGMIHDCDVWVDKLKRYLDNPDILLERSISLNALIHDREKCRSDAYEQALGHWHQMMQSDFSFRLRRLIKYPGNKQTITTGGVTLVDEKNIETPEAEVVVEPVKKPVRKRAPAKKAVQTIVEPETVTPVEEPAPIVADAPAVTEDVVEALPVVEAVSEEPKHPGIVHLKELVKDAKDHLSDTKGMTDKMTKQFKKLEGEMEKLPGRLRKISIKEAAKAEKYLFRLREKIADIPKSEFTKKGIDKVSEEIKSLRKKLPMGKK